MTLAALTGGIGAGKSVAAKIFEAMGCPVYNSDSRARLIMNTDNAVRDALTKRFGNSVYGSDGRLDRARLAKAVFDDNSAREAVNAIVHPAVKRDIMLWTEAISQNHALAFVETAILRESRMEDIFNAVVIVNAPAEVRVKRVMERSKLTRQQVEARIAAQAASQCARFDIHVQIDINNDGRQPLIPQVINATNVLLAL